ncbi:MAG: hypothetical protein ACKVJE_21965 [Pseudomonadales bacterium]
MSNFIIESPIAQSLDGLLDATDFTLVQNIDCLEECGDLFKCIEGLINELNVDECDPALLVGLLRFHKLLGVFLKVYSPRKSSSSPLENTPQLIPKRLSSKVVELFGRGD